MKEECSTCRFYFADSDPDERGECKRYPPTLYFMQRSDGDPDLTNMYFPYLEPDEWCGEYAKRPD